jgi:hypothetical protein
MKPALEAPGSKRLKLERQNTLSNFALKFKLRRYPEGGMMVYDFVFDKTSGKWKKWTETATEVVFTEEDSYTSIIVPTAGAYTRPLPSST